MEQRNNSINGNSLLQTRQEYCPTVEILNEAEIDTAIDTAIDIAFDIEFDIVLEPLKAGKNHERSESGK